MVCLVLAAGYATRLYPLTENFPKPLLPVAGKPILNWLLEDLDAAPEITEYVVIGNHKFNQHFTEWAKTTSLHKPIRVLDDGSTCNENRLGAVRDIRFALDALNLNEDVLVIAGDNILDFSLMEFVRFAIEKGTACVMCHPENDLAKQQRTAIITKDAQDRITSYEEKPKEPKGNLAVPPFYFYRAQDVARISEALAEGCGADAPGSFAAWLSNKTEMHAWEMSGNRYDIGDMCSYEQAQKQFAE